MFASRKSIGKKVFTAVIIITLVVAGATLSGLRPGLDIAAKLPMVADPWPGDIRYFNNSGYQQTLDMAIARWEETGLPIRFIEVSERSAADLVIEDNPKLLEDRCNQAGCHGHAQVGHNPLYWEENVMYLYPPLGKDRDTIDLGRLPILIHELGHVLGLRHNQQLC